MCRTWVRKPKHDRSIRRVTFDGYYRNDWDVVSSGILLLEPRSNIHKSKEESKRWQTDRQRDGGIGGYYGKVGGVKKSSIRLTLRNLHTKD